MKKRHVIVIATAVVVLGLLVFLNRGLIKSLFPSRPAEPPLPQSRQVEPQQPSRIPEDMLQAPSLPDNATGVDQTRDNATGATAADEDDEAPEARGPKAEEVVTWDFADDLARHVVSAYYPPATHPQAPRGGSGITTLSVKELNMRYGTRMTGLSYDDRDLLAGREEVLDYVLSPVVLKVLYSHYAKRFVDSVQQYAQGAQRVFERPGGDTMKRDLDAAHVAECFRISGRWAEAFANTLSAVSRVKDLSGGVQGYLDAVQEAIAANTAFITALARSEDLAQAAEGQDPSPEAQALLDRARQDVESAGRAYEKALRHRERVKQSLVRSIEEQAEKPILGSDESLYVAQWVYRRLVPMKDCPDCPERKDAVAKAGELLADLAGRMQERAAQLSP